MHPTPQVKVMRCLEHPNVLKFIGVHLESRPHCLHLEKAPTVCTYRADPTVCT